MRNGPVKAEDTKAMLMDVAIDLMDEYGFYGVSIDRIVARAGLTKGAFYYYFSDKQEFLHLIHNRFITGLLDESETLLSAGGSATDTLSQLILVAIRTLDAHLPLAKVFFSEMRHLAEPYRTDMVALRDRYQEIFVTTLERGISTGEFAPHLDAKLTVLGYLGMINWMYQWYRPNGRLSPTDIAERFAALMLSGIRAIPSDSPGPSVSSPE